MLIYLVIISILCTTAIITIGTFSFPGKKKKKKGSTRSIMTFKAVFDQSVPVKNVLEMATFHRSQIWAEFNPAVYLCQVPT